MQHENQQADSELRIEPACIDNLPELVDLTMDLFAHSGDLRADSRVQEHGLRLILEQPARGRIFVLLKDDAIYGMVNLLFTISTAMGGFVILMEDVIVHPKHRGHGYGKMLIEHVLSFAKKKNFLRITLLTDKMSEDSQLFFKKMGFEYSTMIPMRKILP